MSSVRNIATMTFVSRDVSDMGLQPHLVCEKYGEKLL